MAEERSDAMEQTPAILNAVSLFSGALGLDLGLESAGIRVRCAAEVDRDARNTIGENRPELPLFGDVTGLSAADICAHESLSDLREQGVDVVVGGPPCQAFSSAGKRKGVRDCRGGLLFEFVRLVKELAPRFFVLENVRGLLSAPFDHVPHADRTEDWSPESATEVPGGVLAALLEEFEGAGYAVTFNLYNAANFGAPQVRERVIIVGAHDGNRPPFLAPTHSDDRRWKLPPWRTLRDAVADLPTSGHEHIEFPEKRLRYYRMLKAGQNWRSLPETLQREALGKSFYAGGGKTGFLRRLAWDAPSPTLVTNPAMPATDLAHPDLPRPLSVQEYARIQGFPDTWQFSGSTLAKYRQIGNAVPLALGAAVGRLLTGLTQEDPEEPPEGFPFSRYRNTCHRTWKAWHEQQMATVVAGKSQRMLF
jgi:DNA (cytosine-5)-methyltransferase 1